MKPLKTRIKAVTKANGRVTYVAQYRHLFVWRKFSEHTTMWQIKSPYNVWINCNYPAESTEIQDVKNLIDKYISKFYQALEYHENSRVTNVRYIKHP